MMTPDFETDSNSRPAPSDGAPDCLSHPASVDGMDNLKRDRFELLSAYLDGEVTAAERRQVEDWLEHDPTVQRLHSRLLKLRQGLRSLTVPEPEYAVEETVQQVLSRLERRPRRFVAWGGVAVAAVFVGALSSVINPALRSPLPAVADNPVPAVPDEGLMIALDQPIMDIPEVPDFDPSKLQKTMQKSSSNVQ